MYTDDISVFCGYPLGLGNDVVWRIKCGGISDGVFIIQLENMNTYLKNVVLGNELIIPVSKERLFMND